MRFFSVPMALLPVPFRARFGAELEAVIESVWAERRTANPLGNLALALRLNFDILSTAVAERFGAGGPPQPKSRQPRPLRPLLFDGFRTDIRMALRSLRRAPAFALAAIVTLGLGIGGVTAMWSLVDGVLLKPLPYRNAERLVRVYNDGGTGQGGSRYFSSSSVQYLAWRDRSGTLESIALIALSPRTLEGGADPAVVLTGLVSSNFFDVLGVTPVLGRGFLPGEDRIGAPKVAILSHELWRVQFGGDSGVLGKTVTLKGAAHEIVGVAPPKFDWLRSQAESGDGKVAIWAPEPLDPAHNGAFFYIVALPKAGVTIAQVDAELGAITEPIVVQAWHGSARADPATWTYVESLNDALYGPVKDRVLLPLAAVLLILLLACANVSNLLLSRLPARRTELAMRSALGATRARLVRQMVTEALVLSSLAAALGLGMAVAITRVVATLGPQDIPRLSDVSVNVSALLASVALAVVCSLLFGLLPAARGSHINLVSDLGQSRFRAQGFFRNRGRAVLLAGQLAIALVLLSGSTLMLRSYGRLRGIEVGMQLERVLHADIRLPADRYQEDLGPIRLGGRGVRLRPAWGEFLDESVRRLKQDTRVIAVGTASFPPLLDAARTDLVAEDRPADKVGPPRERVNANFVGPGFFEALGIPLTAGRGFDDRERDGGTPVVIVNERLARRLWPDGNAVGRRIRYGEDVFEGDSIAWRYQPAEVVGIVADARMESYTTEPQLELYTPLARVMGPRASMHPRLQYQLLVKTTGDPAALADHLRGIVRELDPRVAIAAIAPLQETVNQSLRTPRFYTFLLTFFGGVAALLAAAGVFGVLAFMVSQRSHEIGVRIALGAQRSDVMNLVLRQVALVSALGIAVGLAFTIAGTRLIGSWLYQVRTTDPLSIAAAAALLLISAGSAAWLPTRRAVRVDPARALRAD